MGDTKLPKVRIKPFKLKNHDNVVLSGSNKILKMVLIGVPRDNLDYNRIWGFIRRKVPEGSKFLPIIF